MATRKTKKEPEAVAEVAERNEVTVLWRETARVYRREIHGDNFMELAKAFAEKVHGTIE